MNARPATLVVIEFGASWPRWLNPTGDRGDLAVVAQHYAGPPTDLITQVAMRVTRLQARGWQLSAMVLVSNGRADVPTAAEAGLPELVLDSWLGLFAPARTPSGVIERLRVATLKAVDNVEVRRRLEANGWRIISMSAEETRAFVKREAEKWPAILRQAGIKPE